MTIYIVIGSIGCGYSDEQSWIEKAFTQECLANKYIEELEHERLLDTSLHIGVTWYVKSTELLNEI